MATPANATPSHIVAQIAEMALAGVPAAEIMKATGATYGTVKRRGQAALKAAGVTTGMARPYAAGDTLAAVKKLLRAGSTIADAARKVNRSPEYIKRVGAEAYRQLAREGVKCRCGGDIGHLGSCAHKGSLATSYSTIYPTASQMARRDGLFEKISGLVTRAIAPDVRDDIIQDAYLEILSGAKDVAAVVSRAKSRGLTQWANSYKTISLDVASDDGLSLYNVISSCDGREIDSIWKHDPWPEEEGLEA